MTAALARQNPVVSVSVEGPPLTVLGQEVSFHYSTDYFGLSGNDLVIKDSGIDHNQLKNYAAAKHLDWTIDCEANNIHDNNIVASSITQHEGSIIHNNLASIGVNDHHNRSHVFDGGAHTVSGLSAGHFLQALSPTTFGFAAHGLTYSDVGAIQDAADVIKDSHIDWGTGETQVSAADLPIADEGIFYTATETGAALQEIGKVGELANGSTLREIVLTIASAEGVITANLSSSVGTTISFKFSDGITDVDVTTPITTTLTAGTDTIPVINYLYVLASDPTTLINNITGFPTDVELFTCGKIICQSAASIQTDGCLKEHIFADMIANTVAGHVSHLSHWIRIQWATWDSGVAPTFSGTGTGTISYGSTAGVVSQLHAKTFPQFLDGADIYCANDPDTAYRKITNIGDLQKDSAGVSLTGKTYGLVFWGVLNDNGQSKIFVNLPSGSSNKEGSARQDKDKEINYSIPNDFKGVGFLIYRLIIKNAGDAAWTLYTGGVGDDLRGQFPATSAGSSTALGIDFPDGASGFTLFNAADVTKQIQVDLSGITTGNTRTITFPDGDITLHNTHTGEVTGATELTIAAAAVTLAKMADMATDSFIGRTTTGVGVPEILSKADALAILNVADGADVTATNETSHADVLVDDDIGVIVQVYDDTLLSIAVLGSAANKMLYTTDVDTWAELDLAITVGDPGSDTTLVSEQGIREAIAAGAGEHYHDGDVLQIDGINSDGGVFPFNTSGPVEFTEDIKLGNSGGGCSASNPGSIRYNPDLNCLELCDGSNWLTLDIFPTIVAIGGVVTTYISGSVIYKVHIFTGNGTFNVTSAISGATVNYLVVGGGGGGGGMSGGGGGAGGMRTSSVGITTGEKTVTIGAGGAGGVVNTKGTDGSNSTFDTITAIGGGGGGNRYGFGKDGSSGGGGGVGSTAYPSTIAGGSGTAEQGNDGGDGGSFSTGVRGTGGGGGASTAGANWASSGANGVGGTGRSSNISGVSVTYAGGGGGGSTPAVWGAGTGADGGDGGGGDGADDLGAAGHGTANTGGGGGGGAYDFSGGNGGSGIVIISYPISDVVGLPFAAAVAMGTL